MEDNVTENLCAVLDDAEEKQMTSRGVKIWFDELRDLAFDAEDVLDKFATEALQHKLNGEFDWFFCFLKWIEVSS